MIGVIIFTIIALIISLILVMISNKLNQNDKKEKIYKLLPLYHCGACGFVNCENMALAILEKKENVLKCKPLKNKEQILEEIKNILNS